MAGGERSGAEEERQALDDVIRQNRERHVAIREERRLRAEMLGRRLEDKVEATLADFEEALRQPPRMLARGGKPRPLRPARWKGPHFGKSYRDPGSLERATLDECAAGFTATWGYAMSERDREVFQQVADPTNTSRIEQAARDAYTDLRKAIDAASAFANRHYNQTYGSATVALGHLWGQLPTLARVADLPGYEKSRVPRRELIEQWQRIADHQLRRALAKRELAELSLLLSIGPDKPYAQFFIKRDSAEVQVSPATVLDEEAKRLARFMR